MNSAPPSNSDTAASLAEAVMLVTPTATVAMIDVPIVLPSFPQLTGFAAVTIGFSPEVSAFRNVSSPLSPLLLTVSPLQRAAAAPRSFVGDLLLVGADDRHVEREPREQVPGLLLVEERREEVQARQRERDRER